MELPALDPALMDELDRGGVSFSPSEDAGGAKLSAMELRRLSQWIARCSESCLALLSTPDASEVKFPLEPSRAPGATQNFPEFVDHVMGTTTVDGKKTFSRSF